MVHRSCLTYAGKPQSLTDILGPGEKGSDYAAQEIIVAARIAQMTLTVADAISSCDDQTSFLRR